MTIPQLKNTAVTLAIIIIGIPLASLYHLHLIGELTRWNQIPDALDHAFFNSIWAAVGWLLFRSPYAARITEIFGSNKSTETTADGATKVIENTNKLTVSETPAPASISPAEK